MSRHGTFLKEKKGRSARLSPATKFGRAVWVVEGAGGAYQPKIWPYSHPALRRPKAPLFATSAKRSPNALRARGQVERQWGQGPSHRGPRPAPAPRSGTRKVLRQEDRRGVSTSFLRQSKSCLFVNLAFAFLHSTCHFQAAALKEQEDGRHREALHPWHPQLQPRPRGGKLVPPLQPA